MLVDVWVPWQPARGMIAAQKGRGLLQVAGGYGGYQGADFAHHEGEGPHEGGPRPAGNAATDSDGEAGSVRGEKRALARGAEAAAEQPPAKRQQQHAPKAGSPGRCAFLTAASRAPHPSVQQ